MLLQRVYGQFADIGGGRHKRDSTPFLDQQLSHDAAHVVMVIVINHDMTSWRRAIHQIIRREHWHGRIRGKWHDMLARNAVASPLSTRRDADILEPEFEDASGVEFTVKIDLDIGLLAQLVFAVISHTAPRAEAGKLAFACYPSTQNGTRFGQRDIIAALGHGTRRLKPCWA